VEVAAPEEVVEAPVLVPVPVPVLVPVPLPVSVPVPVLVPVPVPVPVLVPVPVPVLILEAELTDASEMVVEVNVLVVVVRDAVAVVEAVELETVAPIVKELLVA